MKEDYAEAMRSAPERKKPAEKMTREALAQRVASNLIQLFPEPRQLQLIAAALAEDMKHHGIGQR